MHSSRGNHLGQSFYAGTPTRPAHLDNILSTTYLHDLYAKLFVVRITPLIETDLLSLLPIYAVFF